MTNDLIYNEMIQAGADGVDFVPIWIGFPKLPPIIESYTMEQWLSVNCYPRSNRVYWKLDADGNKVYLDDRYNQKPIKDRNTMKIERERWVIVRGNDIFCGLARHYKFKPIDDVGNTAIKTYLSKGKAESSFVSSWWDGKQLLESGEAKAVKVVESLISAEE